MRRELELIKAVEGNMPGVVEECFQEPIIPSEYPRWVEALSYCKEQKITGNLFKKFIISCCESNMSMVLLTEKALKSGLCMPEIVEQNLELNEPVPFINPAEPVFRNNGNELQINEVQRVKLYRRVLERSNLEKKEQ